MLAFFFSSFRWRHCSMLSERYLSAFSCFCEARNEVLPSRSNDLGTTIDFRASTVRPGLAASTGRSLGGGGGGSSFASPARSLGSAGLPGGSRRAAGLGLATTLLALASSGWTLLSSFCGCGGCSSTGLVAVAVLNRLENFQLFSYDLLASESTDKVPFPKKSEH